MVAGGFAAVALSTNVRRRWKRRFAASANGASAEGDAGKRGQTVRGGVGEARRDGSGDGRSLPQPEISGRSSPGFSDDMSSNFPRG